MCLYVDDLRMGGKAENLAEGWKLLRTDSPAGTKGLILDDPVEAELFLGCDSYVRWDAEKKCNVSVNYMDSHNAS